MKNKHMEAIWWYPERAVHLAALNRAAMQKQVITWLHIQTYAMLLR